MKKVISLITIWMLLLTCTPVFAETIGKLNYETAVNEALENNEDLKQVNTSLANAYYRTVSGANQQLKTILENESDTLKIQSGVRYTYNNKLAQMGYYIHQAKDIIKYESNSKNQKEFEIRYKIYSLYNDIDIINKKLELSESKLELLNEQKRIRDLKKELNLVTELEAVLQDQQIQAELLNKTTMENKLKSSYEALNKILGRNINDNTEIEGTASFNVSEIKDYQEAISLAMINRMDLLKEIDKLELEKIRLEVDCMFNAEYSDQIRIQERNVANQEVVVDAKKKEIEQQIYELFKNLENASLNYELLKVNLNNEKSNYKIADLKYELGMIIKSDLMNVEQKLKETELNLQTTKYDLDKLKIKVYNACNLVAPLGN